LPVGSGDRTLDMQGSGILREVKQEPDNTQANADPRQRLTVFLPGLLEAIGHASSL